MLQGIYTAAGAMETATRNHEIVAENLANVATPGYRRQGLLFEVLTPNRANATGAGHPQRSRTYSHFESGPLQQTSNPLDLALVGDGFFVVEGPNGPLYTRNGSFEITQTGELRTRGGGQRVPGVRLPPGASQMMVGPDGTVSVNGAELGRLQLATFDRPDLLRRVGTTLFEGDAAQTPPPGSVRIEQGYREGSNVQAVQEMVAMMVGLRHYEAAEKALRALSEAIAQNTRPQL